MNQGILGSHGSGSSSLFREGLGGRTDRTVHNHARPKKRIQRDQADHGVRRRRRHEPRPGDQCRLHVVAQRRRLQPAAATQAPAAVAFAGALEYAARPQLSLDAVDTGEATLRSRSLTYIAREFGRLVVRDIHNNMRKESDQPRMPSTRARINSHYDLRVSDDELTVRMKYRFLSRPGLRVVNVPLEPRMVFFCANDE